MKGWGPKSLVCPSKPKETNIFGGISRDSCQDIPGAPKSLRNKSLCSIVGPYDCRTFSLQNKTSFEERHATCPNNVKP